MVDARALCAARCVCLCACLHVRALLSRDTFSQATRSFCKRPDLTAPKKKPLQQDDSEASTAVLNNVAGDVGNLEDISMSEEARKKAATAAANAAAQAADNELSDPDELYEVDHAIRSLMQRNSHVGRVILSSSTTSESGDASAAAASADHAAAWPLSPTPISNNVSRQLAVGYADAQGQRATMEDSLIVQCQFGNQSNLVRARARVARVALLTEKPLFFVLFFCCCDRTYWRSLTVMVVQMQLKLQLSSCHSISSMETYMW